MSSPTSSLEILSKNEIVRAGAGAGKTYRLTSHVVNVVNAFRESEGRFPSLVVTTFTRKATQELRERLALRAFESGDEELLDYMTSPVRLHISTIHGVMSLFLKKYSHLFDVDPSFQIVSEEEAKKMEKFVLKEVLANHPDFKPLLSRFSFSRLSALCSSYYEAKLYNEDLKHYTLDDFKTLLQDRIEKWQKRWEVLGSDITSQTSDEKWCRFVRGINQSFISQKDQAQWAQKVLEDLKRLGPKPRVSKKTPQVDEVTDQNLKQLLKLFKEDLKSDHFQDELWILFEEEFYFFSLLGEKFVDRLLESKKNQAKFEMRDLELFSLQVMHQYPEIVQAFSSEWDYWLIDEFQDTSPLQVKLLNQMMAKKPHFIVGDPQQSIYLFRGAQSSVFKQKEEDFKKNKDVHNLLEKNYRSHPELLVFFNDLFTSLDSQFSPMNPREEIFNNDEVSIFFQSYVVSEEDYKEKNEVLGIVKHIQSLISKEVALEKICVLGRTHKVLSQVSQELKKFEIPTHVHTSSGFYQRREVLDALSLLKFLVNPHDNYNLILLLRSPYFKIKDSILISHIEERSAPIWPVIKEKLSELSVVKNLVDLKNKTKTVGYVETFVRALIDYGYFDVSYQQDSTGLRESNLWKLVTKLRENEKSSGFKILEFVSGKIKELQVDSSQEESNAVASLEPNSINLMTVHASKGLEFDHVIIPYMHKKLKKSVTKEFHYNYKENKWSFPILDIETEVWRKSLADRIFVEDMQEQEQKESLRVFYVAVTRAVKSIYFSWSGSPEPNSWGESVLNLAPFKWDNGEHSNDIYKYSVQLNQDRVVASHLSMNSDFHLVREPHQISNAVTDPFRKFSVTSLLKVTHDNSTASEYLPKDLYQYLSKSSEGTLIHKMMETLYYDPEFGFEAISENWFGEKKQKIIDAIEFVRNLKQPNIIEIIKNGKVEWGFQMLTDKGIMEGQVDLWGVVQNDQGEKENWILDYKTGSKSYAHKAFEQLAFYAKAVEKHTQISKTKLAVIFPFDEEVLIKTGSPTHLL